MKDMALNKEDYSIIYSGILELVKKFSSNMSVEGIFVNMMVHNYHNVYGKPVIKLSIITNRIDGMVSELIDTINARYEVYADIKASRVDYKEITTNRFVMTELASSNILYDKYGIYHDIKNKILTNGTNEAVNPRIIKIEKLNVR